MGNDDVAVGGGDSDIAVDVGLLRWVLGPAAPSIGKRGASCEARVSSASSVEEAASSPISWGLLSALLLPLRRLAPIVALLEGALFVEADLV